jgi:hypothetical protein
MNTTLPWRANRLRLFSDNRRGQQWSTSACIEAQLGQGTSIADYDICDQRMAVNPAATSAAASVER